MVEFVSDDAPVMAGKRNGIAEKLKRRSEIILRIDFLLQLPLHTSSRSTVR
jgi:hypothetical protein